MEDEKVREETSEETSNKKSEDVREETGDEGLEEILQESVQEVIETHNEESDEDASSDMVSEEDALTQILDSVAELHKKFDRKIAADEYKDQLFDNMHAELTDYRNGLADKPVEQIAMDIIRMNDALKQSIERYEQADPSEENYRKLLNVLAGVVEDQDDLLYRQEIEAYSVEGDEVDVRRQKTIGSVETDEESLHNTVAERTVCGYEKDGKVIRPERVKIYKYASKEEV